MSKYPRRRLYRLSPWIIRALIPEAHIGTYILFSVTAEGLSPIYVGRSDTCLRRRLISHNQRGQYFDYDIFWTRESAFIAECSLYHALSHRTANLIHPSTPKDSKVMCPFCRSVFNQIKIHRFKCF